MSNSEKHGRILTDAERAVARYNLLTTGEVAERLSQTNVNGDTVRRWCAAGWLTHIDGRRPGSKHPYYLVEWRWVEEFIARGGAAAHADDAA